MLLIDPQLVLALATLCTALSTLVWAIRRRR
jgi:hypothetical protein